jgi:outer membrane protein assembly factor BamB
MRIAVKTFVHLVLASTVCTALAQDWPQLLGPAHDGVYNGALPTGKIAWKKDVGPGFSAPVVAGGRLILFHRLGDRETVQSLDAKTGRQIWSFDYPTRYRDDFGFDEGPRAAPVISAGRVFTYGAEGMLHALDFATGKKIWSVDARLKFSAPKSFFGAGSGLLVEAGRVLLNVGGTKGGGIAAFDVATGNVVWTATDDEASYSTPVAATFGGVRHALFFTRSGLVDIDPASGKVRFQFHWRSRSHASVNAAVPVIAGDAIFLSASYETGATLLRIEGDKPKQIWASDDALSNHYATSVYRDGYLYGYHGRQEFGQSLRSIDAKTGKVQWSVDGFGAGTVTLARDRLVLLKENGELVIAPASPKEFKPVSKLQLLPATVRAYPALADGRLYARNEKTLVCLE